MVFFLGSFSESANNANRSSKSNHAKSVENIGAKLVRQAASKTNDLAGDGTTTSVVLAQGLIAEGVKVVGAGANPVQITRGIEKTVKALVAELKLMSKEVSLDFLLTLCLYFHAAIQHTNSLRNLRNLDSLLFMWYKR